MSGFLLTIEGGEGTGKSTLAARLEATLEEKGIEVVLSREPGGTPEGDALRGVLLGHQLAPETELDLLLAGRAHHCVTVVAPALARGAWVILDRFIDSSLAYQAGERPGWNQEVLALSRLAAGEVWPDLTLWLDMDAAKGLSRAKGDASFEQRELSFHNRVRDGYAQIARNDPQRVKRLDIDEMDADAVFEWALNQLEIQ
ncbi:dTMP kinase [bacterium]|nr:dTMP kinase [bacterium]